MVDQQTSRVAEAVAQAYARDVLLPADTKVVRLLVYFDGDASYQLAPPALAYAHWWGDAEELDDADGDDAVELDAPNVEDVPEIDFGSVVTSVRLDPDRVAAVYRKDGTLYGSAYLTDTRFGRELTGSAQRGPAPPIVSAFPGPPRVVSATPPGRWSEGAVSLELGASEVTIQGRVQGEQNFGPAERLLEDTLRGSLGERGAARAVLEAERARIPGSTGGKRVRWELVAAGGRPDLLQA
jgi:hypothetical protein